VDVAAGAHEERRVGSESGKKGPPGDLLPLILAGVLKTGEQWSELYTLQFFCKNARK